MSTLVTRPKTCSKDIKHLRSLILTTTKIHTKNMKDSSSWTMRRVKWGTKMETKTKILKMLRKTSKLSWSLKFSSFHQLLLKETCNHKVKLTRTLLTKTSTFRTVARISTWQCKLLKITISTQPNLKRGREMPRGISSRSWKARMDSLESMTREQRLSIWTSRQIYLKICKKRRTKTTSIDSCFLRTTTSKIS